MPKVELIETSEVPVKLGTRNGPEILEAVEHLKRAIRENKAISLTLGEEERDSRFRNIYKKAAQELHIGIICTAGPPRTYTSASGKEWTEPEVLYFRITKPAKPVDDNGHMVSRRPIDTTPRPPVREEITGALVSR